LVVEDQTEMLKQLDKLLSESLGGAVIHTARTVVEALETLDRADRSQVDYDVAIVDFKLPEKEGDNPEVQYAVCDRIHQTMLDTMVVHITGFKSDGDVIAHVFRGDSRSTLSPQVLFISKDDVEWAAKLLRKVKEFVYGTPIRRRIDDIFGSRGQSRGVPVERHAHRRYGRTGLSHDLAALTRQIAEHWEDLDKPLRRRIQRVFRIDTSEEPIRVGLL